MVGQQHASAGARVLVLACAVLVAGGVLAMHALVTTALPAAGDDAIDRAASVVAGTAAHTAHAGEAVDVVGASETDAGSHGLHHGLLDVCLALVVALGLVVLASAALRVGTRLRLVDRTVQAACRFHARAVGPPAPDLHALSVLRC